MSDSHTLVLFHTIRLIRFLAFLALLTLKLHVLLRKELDVFKLALFANQTFYKSNKLK